MCGKISEPTETIAGLVPEDTPDGEDGVAGAASPRLSSDVVERGSGGQELEDVGCECR